MALHSVDLFQEKRSVPDKKDSVCLLPPSGHRAALIPLTTPCCVQVRVEPRLRLICLPCFPPIFTLFDQVLHTGIVPPCHFFPRYSHTLRQAPWDLGTAGLSHTHVCPCLPIAGQYCRLTSPSEALMLTAWAFGRGPPLPNIERGPWDSVTPNSSPSLRSFPASGSGRSPPE